MEIKKLENSVGVSPQITTADLTMIKELGYRVVVCHRPDGEGVDQINFDEIEQSAKALNLQTVYQPIVSGKINDDDVATFKSILNDTKGPVFAYCRTGTRSATLWSLAKAGELSVSEILSTAKLAGYDMSDVVRHIVNGGVAPIDQTR